MLTLTNRTAPLATDGQNGKHMTTHEVMIVRTTNGVAMVGLSLPAWWPTLAEASAFAAAVVPILSGFWLLLQIARTLYQMLTDRKNKGKPAEGEV